MNPKRLSEGAKGERVAAMLRTMQSDAPSQRSKARAMAALGVGAAMGAAEVASATVAAKSSIWAATGVLKWIGMGAVVGGVTVAGLGQIQSRPSSPAVVVASSPAPVQTSSARHGQASLPIESAEATSEEPAAPEPSHRAVAVPAPSQQPSAPRASAEVETAPVASAASQSSEQAAALAREVKALDGVRAAISAGNPGGALQRLAEYRAAFSPRQLESEALMLQIQATGMSGDRAGAQALARAFIAQHPRSPLVDRVRSMAGLGPIEKSSAP